MRVTVVIAIYLALLACSPAWAEQSAEDILEASGVKGGLVVHIGCGDGKLTAALRAGDAFVVQGLDTDPTNVEKARAHIQSLGLGGKVSADVFDRSIGRTTASCGSQAWLELYRGLWYPESLNGAF